MSINWQKDKLKIVYPYNAILFSNKEEWSTDTCYNVDNPWKHMLSERIHTQKGHIMYDSMYMKYPE